MSRKYIAAGFRQDMESLFSKFIDSEEPDTKENGSTDSSEKKEPTIRLRYSRFARVWRQFSFSLIFKARLNENELRELIDEIYLEVLPQLTIDKPFERRVSSLYLLYSLFVKQPKTDPNLPKTDPKLPITNSNLQKIRINYLYLEAIRELVSRAKQMEQFDVCYVWYKLLSLGAIDFVHVSRLMGPYYIRNSRVTTETETYTDFLIDQFKSSVYPSVDELSHIHEQYRFMKDALTEDKVEDMNTINQVEDNIFELYKAKMDNLQKEFANQRPSQETQSFENQFNQELYQSDLPLLDDDIGSRRRKIREKAMTSHTSHVSNSVQSNDSSEQTQIKRKRGRPKKCKLIQ